MRSLVALCLMTVACSGEQARLEAEAAESRRRLEISYALYLAGDACLANGPGSRWQDRPSYAPSREYFVRVAREESDPAILDSVFTTSLDCEDLETAWEVLGRLGGVATFPEASECVVISMSNLLQCRRKQLFSGHCCGADGTCVDRPGCSEFCATTCPAAPPP